MVWQRLTVYGNEKIMRVRKCTSLGLVLALCLICSWGCVPRPAPVIPPGLALQPGRYLTAFYRAPDFAPAPATYVLTPWPVETAQGLSAATFQNLFMEELSQAWLANGLKIAPQGDTVLAGVVQLVAIRGAAIRFITGKLDCDLVVSGTISRGDAVQFAFQDRLRLSSPVNPGLAAPKEEELLMRQTARGFAVNLLNEMLLYWPAAEGK